MDTLLIVPLGDAKKLQISKYTVKRWALYNGAISIKGLFRSYLRCKMTF